MRIQLCSDLHLEFYSERKVERVLENLVPQTDADVLVMAGDVGPARLTVEALRVMGGRYPHVVYVAGNHEFYRSTREEFWGTVRGWLSPKNVHVLENEVAVIGGKRFLGTTLWFPYSKEAELNRAMMGDFYHIARFDEWWRVAHNEATLFLNGELREGDILVTHHLPSKESVSPQFVGSPLNCYFVGDIEPLIRERKPAAVFYGHTHCPGAHNIGKTLVACNPSGYPNEGVLPRAWIAEVP